jgi:ADP-heptose:LPS heptosyltransferase
MKIMPVEHYRLALYKVDRIGDFVLALSAIRLLVDRYGAEHSCLIVSTLVEPLAQREFPAVDLLVVPGFPFRRRDLFSLRFIRLFFKLCRVKCDQLICLRHQRSPAEEVLCRRVRADEKTALDGMNSGLWKSQSGKASARTGWSRLVAASDESGADDASCRELQWHRILLSTVFGRAVDSAAILPEFKYFNIQTGSGLLVAPFAASEQRELPPETLADVLVYWRRIHPESAIIITGTRAQEPKAVRLRDLLAAAGVSGVSISCSSGLNEYIELVAEAGAVLTMESATAHIATTLDKRTAVVIGGGHYGHFGPWWKSGRQRWISRSMECFGCSWCCRYAEIKCITDIPARQIELVLDAL